MTIVVNDFPDVETRSARLGLRAPTTLAILPRNFDSALAADELLHEEATLSVRKLWRAEGLAFEELEREGQRLSIVHERELLWIGPTIFVAASYFSENATAINVALSVVANYVTELFKGAAEKPRVKLKVVVAKSKNKTTKQLEYEGDPEGLHAIVDAVKELAKE